MSEESSVEESSNNDDENDCLESNAHLSIPSVTQSSQLTNSTSISSVTNPETDLLPIKTLTANKNKRRKQNPYWKFFAPLDPTYPEWKKNTYVCLVCRNQKTNKTVSLGEVRPSPAALKNHFMANHRDIYENNVQSEINEQKRQQSTSLTLHLKPKTDIKKQHKINFARWIVEDDMPFSQHESPALKRMLQNLNVKVVNPERKECLHILTTLRLTTQDTIKSIIGDNYYSITTDHWTSVANDNYGCITIHFITNFELKSFVLSFEFHSGGSSGEELSTQLWNSIGKWQLNKKKLMVLVTDSASNMNTMGEIVMNEHTSITHHYCADHILQLTCNKAFSNQSHVQSLDRLKQLVNFIHSSTQAQERFDNIQKNLNNNNKTLKLKSDCKTRWWSTYAMVERAIKLETHLIFLREQERNRPRPDRIQEHCLTNDDFTKLKIIKEVLEPFYDAQECLEGQHYVNISLLPLCIHKLHETLTAALVDVTNYEIRQLLDEMYEDFVTRWGRDIRYSSQIIRRSGNYFTN